MSVMKYSRNSEIGSPADVRLTISPVALASHGSMTGRGGNLSMAVKMKRAGVASGLPWLSTA